MTNNLAVVAAGQLFEEGDSVYHRSWHTVGIVHVHVDAQPDEAQAEVQWDGVSAADELDLVADQLTKLSSP